MIKINKSKTADTRTCDFAKVSRETLLLSTLQHLRDVNQGFEFFKTIMNESNKNHDRDKITDLDGFHRDFIGGFVETTWWDNHRKVNRHHLLADDGVPEDVNLIDVLDMIIDCVMAGMGRSGSVYPLEIKSEVLINAFNNTVELLKKNVEVID